MARRRMITKTRALERVRCIRLASACLIKEVDALQPASNERHRRRMQSIMGAGFLREMQEAQDKIERATRMLRSIKGGY
jgi:hypothetical protein